MAEARDKSTKKRGTRKKKTQITSGLFIWNKTKPEILQFLQTSETHEAKLKTIDPSTKITSIKGKLVITILKPVSKLDTWEKDCTMKLNAFNQKYHTYEISVHPKPPDNLIQPFLGKSNDVMTTWDERTLVLVVTGVKEIVDLKVNQVEDLLKKSKHFSNLLIEKNYHCFIIGRKGETKKKLSEKYQAELSFPKIYGNEDSVIQISSYCKGSVENIVSEIVDIYNKMKISCTSTDMTSTGELTNKQLESFFDDVGVHLTKNEKPNSYHMLGPADLISSAQKHILILLKQNEIVEKSISADDWIIRIIQSKPNIPFLEKKTSIQYIPDSGKIGIRGMRSEVNRLSQILEARVAKEASNKMQVTVTMESKFYYRLFGNEMKAETDVHCKHCEVAIQQGKYGNNVTVLITGVKAQAEKAQQYLVSSIEKMNTTVVKRVFVDANLLKYAMGDFYHNLVDIRKRFPKVCVEFLDQNSTTKENLSLSGIADAVEECYGCLLKTLKTIAEVNDVTTKTLSAAQWVVKRLASRNDIRYDRSKVTLDFQLEKGNIVIKGPKMKIEGLFKFMSKLIVDEQNSNTQFVIQKVSSKYYNVIFNEDFEEINKLTKDCECEIYAVPVNKQQSQYDIIIVGSKHNVEIAKQYLQNKMALLERFVTTTIFVEKQVAKFLTGKNGALNEVKQKHTLVKLYMNKQQNICIEGDRDLVEACKRHMNKVVQQVKRDKIPCIIMESFKSFHKNIIGRNGEMVQKIKAETRTRIEIPNMNSDDTVIKIFGNKQDCEKAVQMIKDIERNVGNIVEQCVDVNDLFKDIFVVVEIRLKEILKTQYGVIIDGMKNDAELVLRGKNDDIKKSLSFLKTFSGVNIKVSTVQCKQEHQEYLFGYNDQTLYQIQKETKCVVLQPLKDDFQPKQIFIIGQSEDVETATSTFSNHIKDLVDIAKMKIDMQLKHVKFYQSHNQSQMMLLLKKYPSVLIKFADSLNNSFKVLKVRGPRKQVDDVVREIQENKDKLDNETRLEFVFPKSSISSFTPAVTNEMSEKHSVRIQRVIIPNHPPKLLIFGQVDICMAAKMELQSRIKKKVTKYINIPFHMHGRIIGHKGSGLNDIKQQCNSVWIKFPERGSQSDNVKIQGLKEDVEQAVLLLQQKTKAMYPLHRFDVRSIDGESDTESNISFDEHQADVNTSLEDTTEEEYKERIEVEHIEVNYGNNFQRIETPSTVVFGKNEHPFVHSQSYVATTSHSYPDARQRRELPVHDASSVPVVSVMKNVEINFDMKRFGAFDVLTNNEGYIELFAKNCNCEVSFSEYKRENLSSMLQLPLQGKIKVNAAVCDITEVSYDCIVRSSGLDFSFNGQLASAILKKGGNSIKTECENKQMLGKIIITNAGTLPCKNIMHVALESRWNKFNEIMINILDLVKVNGIQSLAMPIIGTGGMSIDADTVLNGLKQGLDEWQRSHDYELKLTFVIFNDENLKKKVKDTFGIKNIVERKSSIQTSPNSLFENLKRLTGFWSIPSPAAISVDTFSFDDDTNNNVSNTVKEKCIRGAYIKIKGDTYENVGKVRKFIEEKVEEEMHVEILQDNILSLLSKNDLQKLIDITKDFSVYMKFDRNVNGAVELHIDGARRNTREAIFKLSSFIKDLKHETDNFPPGWVKTRLENFLLDLQETSNEYQNVKKLFLSTAKNKRFQIEKIQKVQNIMLWKQYELKKKAMRMKAVGGTLEKELFHGTSKDAIEQICSRGFDKGFCGKNGTVYGQGVYFADNSHYSHSYTSSGKIKHMFLSNVLIGRFCKGSSTLIAPPFLPGSLTERYDCAVNEESNPSIFVVFRDADSYPAFIITYTEVTYTLSLF